MLNKRKIPVGVACVSEVTVSDLVANSVTSWPQSCIAGSRQNGILEALSLRAYRLLSAHLKEEDYAAGHVLWDLRTSISHVFLPVSGLLAIHSGEIEVATVGSEGAAGFQDWPSLAPSATRGIVCIAGRFLCIPLHAFAAACNQSEEIRLIAALCNTWLLLQSQHLASCNAIHPARQRFCRWLLRASDALGAGELSATQERIADALGIRRPTAVLIAKGLQSQGAIEYRRGRIKILNREALQTASCNCYTAFDQSRWPSKLVNESSRPQLEVHVPSPAAIDMIVRPKGNIPQSAGDPASCLPQQINASAEPAVPRPSTASLASCHARIAYCPATAPATVHERDALLMIILEGTGKLVPLVHENHTNSYPISAGANRSFSKGDALILAPSAPHQVVPTSDSPIVLLIVHLPSLPTADDIPLVPGRLPSTPPQPAAASLGNPPHS